MEKAPTYTETYGNITPPKEPEPVGWLSRMVAKLLLRGNHSWKARYVNPQEAPLLAMVTKLCPVMGIKTPPELIIYSSPYPNAASTVNGKVLVSTELLRIMTPAQVEGVIGHELSHHRHKLRDTLIMFGGLGALGVAYQNLFKPKVHGWIDGFKNRFVRAAAYVAEFGATFLGAVGLLNLYQQKIEYQADRESGEATGRPKVLAQGLIALTERSEKIQQETKKARRAKMSETGKMIADTIERIEPKWVRRIRHNPFEVLGSHPPTPLRVEALDAQDAHMHQDKESLPAPLVMR